MRPCLDCQRLTTKTRCPACQQAKDQARYQRKGHRYRQGDYQARRRALLADNPPCYWCGQPATTADHLQPLAHGGTHDTLVPACARCNSSRGARPPRDNQQGQGTPPD